MTLPRIRRFAALVALAALALSPAFPVGGACLSSCGRIPARAAPACCRPRAATAPVALRAPSCCRPRPGSEPRLVTIAVEPGDHRHASASLAAAVAIAPAAPRLVSGTFLLAQAESPPPLPSASRTILRI